MKQIDSLVDTCINKGYITQEQAPWLRYGIEKRITSFLISIPMLIVGSWISSPAITIPFYVSFCLLRTRTNGIHAQSLGGCFILSILTEVVFLGVLPRVWNGIVAIVLLMASTICIYALAPYNHPNMDLSPEEFAACGQSAKRRLLLLVLLLIVLRAWHFNQFATGILLGIVMVAVTLTFTYILKGERQYEKTEKCH